MVFRGGQYDFEMYRDFMVINTVTRKQAIKRMKKSTLIVFKPFLISSNVLEQFIFTNTFHGNRLL